jgi:hypothetical protein
MEQNGKRMRSNKRIMNMKRRFFLVFLGPGKTGLDLNYNCTYSCIQFPRIHVCVSVPEYRTNNSINVLTAALEDLAEFTYLGGHANKSKLHS